MTKKDYELIATALRQATITGTCVRSSSDLDLVNATHRAAASSLASALERDNPRFDRDRFLAACVLDGYEL